MREESAFRWDGRSRRTPPRAVRSLLRPVADARSDRPGPQTHTQATEAHRPQPQMRTLASCPLLPSCHETQFVTFEGESPTCAPELSSNGGRRTTKAAMRAGGAIPRRHRLRRGHVEPPPVLLHTRDRASEPSVRECSGEHEQFAGNLRAVSTDRINANTRRARYCRNRSQERDDTSHRGGER